MNVNESEYTPSTEQVRDAYVRAIRNAFVGSTSEHAAEFDRWHDKERAEAQVQALRMAADDITLSWSRGMVTALATECHKKQCRCGNPAPEELARQIALAYRDQIRKEAEIIAREEGIETGESRGRKN